jgi:hypothetical protein
MRPQSRGLSLVAKVWHCCEGNNIKFLANRLACPAVCMDVSKTPRDLSALQTSLRSHIVLPALFPAWICLACPVSETPRDLFALQTSLRNPIVLPALFPAWICQRGHETCLHCSIACPADVPTQPYRFACPVACMCVCVKNGHAPRHGHRKIALLRPNTRPQIRKNVYFRAMRCVVRSRATRN